jgi:hypothetical protein
MMFVVVNKNIKFSGMAIWPFIIVKNEKLRTDKELINHELIHHRQQLELLLVPFYLLYLVNYLVNLVKFKNHDKAYRAIIFEREAYALESDLQYLVNRKPFAWLKFIKT